MTKNTNSNNIKPMFTGIAQVMMILLRLLTTRTQETVGARHFACCNSIIYSVKSSTFFRIIFAISFIGLFHGLFALFGLLILFIVKNTFFSLAILFSGSFTFLSSLKMFLVHFISFGFMILPHVDNMAGFTLGLKSVFCVFVFLKFKNRLNLFAGTTTFCYDLLRHNRFSNKRFCFESVMRPILMPDSFYYNTRKGAVNL